MTLEFSPGGQEFLEFALLSFLFEQVSDLGRFDLALNEVGLSLVEYRSIPEFQWRKCGGSLTMLSFRGVHCDSITNSCDSLLFCDNFPKSKG